jgi:sugar-phosphatase
MTVWSVNTPAAPEGAPSAHRHFVSLREAVPHILDFAS